MFFLNTYVEKSNAMVRIVDFVVTKVRNDYKTLL